jgi:hypothetical protein
MSLRILEQDIPGITARVGSLSPAQRRRLAREAARLAARIAPVDDERMSRGLAMLESDDVDAAVTERLHALMDELDDQAAALQLRLDAFGNPPEDEPDLEKRYVRAFTQARTVEAVIAALEPDVDEAAADALYEARAALDDAPAAIRALVEAVADGVDDPADHVVRQLAR